MTASVHPVQGGVQGGVQGRNPRRHWLGQGVQGSSQRGRMRANADCSATTHARRIARTRIPLHPLHALGSSFASGAVVDGTNDLMGRRLMALRVQPSSTTAGGTVFVDITGPWSR